MSHIFISYSRKDKDYAKLLVQKLKQHAIPIWIDSQIKYGTEWTQEIEAGIDMCRAFILIMSSYSKESEWVQRELGIAKDKGKQIYPILLEGEPWSAVASIQHVDARSGQLPQNQFFSTLRRSAYPEHFLNIEYRPISELPSTLPNGWHFLPRIHDATKFLSLINRTTVILPHFAEPLDEEEASRIDSFWEKVKNLWKSQVPGNVNAEAAFSLRKTIEALEQRGLYVYAVYDDKTTLIDPNTQQAVKQVIIAIERADEDHIIVKME